MTFEEFVNIELPDNLKLNQECRACRSIPRRQAVI